MVISRCEDAVKAYLADSDADAVINVGADMRKIHHCFRIMKVTNLAICPSEFNS